MKLISISMQPYVYYCLCKVTDANLYIILTRNTVKIVISLYPPLNYIFMIEWDPCTVHGEN